MDYEEEDIKEIKGACVNYVRKIESCLKIKSFD